MTLLERERLRATPASTTSPTSMFSGPRLIAAFAIVCLGVALRLWHLRHGLPNLVEEAIPFRRALEMWSGDGSSVDWNPHFFHYPSLTIYLHFVLQKIHYGIGHLLGWYRNGADYLVSFQTDPTPMVTLARCVGIAADLVTMIMVIRIGERLRPGAGLIAVFLVACSPALIGASRSIFADDMMVALATASLERMLAYRERGGTKRIVATIVLLGLAAGAKYPAAVLLIPLGWVLWERSGARGLATWVVAAAGAFAVFLATTPYALADLARFRRDFAFVGSMGSAGTLGHTEGAGFLYHLATLTHDLGWIGVALLIGSLILTVQQARTRGDLVTMWLAVLAFGAPIAFAHVLAERYLDPVLPLVAVLVGYAVLVLAERLPARRVALALLLAALLAPSLVSGVRAGALVAESTQLQAARWCEEHLDADDLLVQEFHGAPLLGHMDWLWLQSRSGFAAAGDSVRSRYLARRWFSVVTLPLAVVGPNDNAVRTPHGWVRIEVFPHVADYNQIVYDPRLFAGVDFVLTSSAVRGRFEADRERYAAENRFYGLLDSTAEESARFRPRMVGSGPELVIYRLGPRARAAIDRFGPLDPLWWADRIPATYRARAEALANPGRPAQLGVRGADGNPSPWVRGLDPIFAAQFAPHGFAMSLELMQHDRIEPARLLAQSIVVMQPGDVKACLIFSACSKRLGYWSDARAAVERTLVSLSRTGDGSPMLDLEHAELLAHDGEVDRARAELESLLRSPNEFAASEARRRLEELDRPSAPRP